MALLNPPLHEVTGADYSLASRADFTIGLSTATFNVDYQFSDRVVIVVNTAHHVEEAAPAEASAPAHSFVLGLSRVFGIFSPRAHERPIFEAVADRIEKATARVTEPKRPA